MADNAFEEFKAEAPTLTFDTAEEAQAEPAKATVSSEDRQAGMAKDAQLTPEEMAQVDAFVEQIDISNSQAIMNYGVGTQKKMADFSEKAIDNVRTKDMGEVGEMLSGLVTQLKDFDVDENEKGLKAIFKKGGNKIVAMKAKYARVETNVNAVSAELEKHQVQLMKDVELLDRMYDLNLNYFRELTMYIIAGKKRLEKARNEELVALQKKAEQSGLQEDAQAAKDFAAQIDRFEKKLHDLELTRTIAMQTGPQIRMVQSSDTVMAEKIQSTIVNTIPLWKNQMVIALGVEHAAQAAKAEREVNDMTNELLKKNADKLKTATIEAAKESERGIVDIETLRHTNEQLISTIDEVMAIQKDGREKRAAAQQELVDIENQLKDKLLQAAKA
ncbi:MAG: toxic anion resistance protein [Lachnospiraceae bacterium]|nr:toxic anion resistance protein [Lachnospiraceae bacterium]